MLVHEGLQAGVGTCQTKDGAVGGQPLYRLVDGVGAL